MRKCVVETDRRMPFSCRIANAINTHSEYVIITAFPLQQWLHERASALSYKYISTNRGKTHLTAT
jgi:hypothetical protein